MLKQQEENYGITVLHFTINYVKSKHNDVKVIRQV